MQNVGQYVSNILLGDSTLITLLGSSNHISTVRPDIIETFPMVIYNTEQRDKEFVDELPRTSDAIVTIDIFVKNDSTYAIGKEIADLFLPLLWTCSYNSDGEDPNPIVRHRTMKFQKSNFDSDLYYTLSSNKSITAFSIINPAITGTITSTTITLTLPIGTDPSILTATWTTNGNSVKIGSVVQIPGMTVNDFTNPVTYTVVAQDATTQDYTVNTKYLYVTYDGNGSDGGTAPTDTTVYQYGGTATVLTSGTLTYTGFTFSKWNTLANGSGTNYDPTDMFSIVSNTTLYAQWI